MTEQSEMHKKKKKANIALGLTLGALVVLFFTVTLVKIGGNITNWGY